MARKSNDSKWFLSASQAFVVNSGLQGVQQAQNELQARMDLVFSELAQTRGVDAATMTGDLQHNEDGTPFFAVKPKA